jgi:ATP-dependent DNA helicase RecQ
MYGILFFCKSLRKLLAHPYAQRIRDNYAKPLYLYPDGLAAMQLALTPLAIARIQLTLLEALKTGALSLEAEEWRLAVIERDVPCAFLALQDWSQLVSHLRSLAGFKGDKLPRVRPKIYRTPEFSWASLAEGEQAELYGEEKEPYAADLLIDIAMLQRRGFSQPSSRFHQTVQATYQAVIRSAHTSQEPWTVRCARPISYCVPEGDPTASLVYFLQNIFRKKEFRPGQVDILKRTLTRQNVIALLPTGAGKSLTYQLSALLQPGIVLVVDPLKSLMQDQDQNLRDAGIDATTFINSTIKATEREKRSTRMTQGWYQFVFVSPERLQIPEFRNYLLQMRDVHFSYAVVDEAHCVSEWGHDFRPAYLRLGVNARKFCQAAEGEVPIIALTGTASFDVLDDVQRELDIHDEMARVVPSEYRRDELHFEITPIPPPVIPPTASAWEMKQAVGASKQATLNTLLDTIPQRFGAHPGIVDFLTASGESPNAGLIFCPYVGGVLGVKQVGLDHRIGHLASHRPQKIERLNSSRG